MSTVCVITPMIIGAWPGIVAASVGAAQALGFAVLSSELAERLNAQTGPTSRRAVTIEVDNSDVVAEYLSGQQEIVLEGRDGVIVRIRRDDRGRLNVCAEGESVSKAELHAIGERVAGRIVQQFAYNHLMTELAARNYEIVENAVESDESIRIRVRANG